MHLADPFIVAYLVFAVFWDAPEANLVHRRVRATLRRVVTGLGLGHRWNMYAGPFTHIIELEARALHPDGAVERIALPARYEFRRYGFMLARQQDERLYQGLADYVAARLCAHVRRPTELVIVRRVAATPARVGGWRGRFAVAPPVFRETIVARRTLP
jgi:hypothetical protein